MEIGIFIVVDLKQECQFFAIWIMKCYRNAQTFLSERSKSKQKQNNLQKNFWRRLVAEYEQLNASGQFVKKIEKNYQMRHDM